MQAMRVSVDEERDAVAGENEHIAALTRVRHNNYKKIMYRQSDFALDFDPLSNSRHTHISTLLSNICVNQTPLSNRCHSRIVAAPE